MYSCFCVTCANVHTYLHDWILHAAGARAKSDSSQEEYGITPENKKGGLGRTCVQDVLGSMSCLLHELASILLGSLIFVAPMYITHMHTHTHQHIRTHTHTCINTSLDSFLTYT